MTRWIEGLAALGERYDGYLVDQFGVLHDGRRAYPGAADALRELKARGKRVVVLSNSGKRAAPNARRLAEFGVTPAHYDALVTSGELVWQMLQQRDRAPFSGLGRRVLLGQPEVDAALVEGLDLQVVGDPARADWVLLASVPEQRPAEGLWPLLDAARARGLPLVCANPDLMRLGARGVEPSCGWLAQRYAAAGGEVCWLGKPHPLIYGVCRETLGRWGARRLLAVGDSLAHDIAGGAAAGYDTCFVAGGLQAADFATAPDRAAVLYRLLAGEEAGGAPAPGWALPTLRWGATEPENPAP